MMAGLFQPSPYSHARSNTGEAASIDWTAAAQAVGSLVGGGIALGVQARQANLQRQHEEEMAQEQAKLYALQGQAASAQARLAAAQAAMARSNTLKYALIGGSVLVGLGMIALALKGSKEG